MSLGPGRCLVRVRDRQFKTPIGVGAPEFEFVSLRVVVRCLRTVCLGVCCRQLRLQLGLPYARRCRSIRSGCGPACFFPRRVTGLHVSPRTCEVRNLSPSPCTETSSPYPETRTRTPIRTSADSRTAAGCGTVAHLMRNDVGQALQHWQAAVRRLRGLDPRTQQWRLILSEVQTARKVYKGRVRRDREEAGPH